MTNEMKLLGLCQYTLRQSLCDEGVYPEIYTAKDLEEDLE